MSLCRLLRQHLTQNDTKNFSKEFLPFLYNNQFLSKLGRINSKCEGSTKHNESLVDSSSTPCYFIVISHVPKIFVQETMDMDNFHINKYNFLL